MPAIAVQVAERRAFGGGSCGDARRLLRYGSRESDEQAAVDEVVKIDAPVWLSLSMQRSRVAVRRQLQRAEPQHLAAAALVAHLAVAGARDGVGAPTGQNVGSALTLVRNQQRLPAVG